MQSAKYRKYADEWLKSAMINEERYEEAAKINKCIEDEYNKLKNGKQ